MCLFSQLENCLLSNDMEEKCRLVERIYSDFAKHPESHRILQDGAVREIRRPGMPEQLRLVAPRELTKRSIQKQNGRNVLMHAIAHIEFNAINLALDAAYRFKNQPREFYLDWLSVAADEARHFQLIREYLVANGLDYGDLPAHNGLWEMAVDTANDVVARMALVPRVLEARGLDVTPGIIKRLTNVGDQAAIDILKVIYQDEIDHVRIGSKWFAYQCQKRGLEARPTFKRMINRHLHGGLKGPFNIEARLMAGFDQEELDSLSLGTIN